MKKRPVLTLIITLLLVTSMFALMPPAQAVSLNRGPDAQAGPSPMVVDGGSGDEDGANDGSVSITFDAKRSTDPDNELNNDITCTDLLSSFSDEELKYRWYRGHDVSTDNATPIATGMLVTISLSYGLHNFTLEVEDKCGKTDTDIVTAFALNNSATTEKTWSFDNGAPEALTETEGFWRVTSECGVSSDGQYLAFNRPEVCDYDTNTSVSANATFEYDLGEWFVAGIQFDTMWDTRDDYVEALQDHLTVRASLDHGATWTPANLTFDVAQGEYEANSSWVRASGIFDLKKAPYKSGNVTFRFTFDTNSTVDAGKLGWLVDNITLVGLRDSIYTATWGNHTYQEVGDPLERFDNITVTDKDGDGVGELESLPHTPMTPTQSMADITNAEVQESLDALNITKQEIVDGINKTLSWNASWDDERENATDHIYAGQYSQANAELEGTLAEIHYLCNGELEQWYVEATLNRDCNGDGEDDTRFRTEVASVDVFSGSLDGIDLYFNVTKTTSEEWDDKVGAYYQGHLLGVQAVPFDRPFKFEISYSGMSNSDKSRVEFSVFGKWAFMPPEYVFYVNGISLEKDLTIKTIFEWESYIALDIVVKDKSQGKDVIARVTEGYETSGYRTLKRIDAFLPFQDKQVDLQAWQVPRELELGWRAERHSSGDAYKVLLEDPTSGTNELSNLEIQGSYREEKSNGEMKSEFDFAFVGFPEKNTLRIRPGQDPNSGCNDEDTKNVVSLDLTKRRDWYDGRYRSITANGNTCDKAIDVTINDVHRVRLWTARNDQTDEANGDGDTALFIGGAVYPQADSGVYVTATEDWWLDLELDNRLFNHDPDCCPAEAHWYTNGLEGHVDWGYWVWRDGWSVNSYWWSITEDQLWITTCAHKFSDGTCY